MLRRLLSLRSFALVVLVALACAVATHADARAGRGLNLGTRGMNTFSAPPSTMTAPRPAPSIDRTITRPTTPNSAFPVQPQRPGLFGGLLGGFLTGLLGASLFHMLTGSGFGFLLQLLLIGGLIYLVVRFIRSRATFPASGPSLRTAYGPTPTPQGTSYTGSAGLGQAPRGPARAPYDAVGIKPEDYQEFERLLSEIQLAYGREDVGALRQRATPEMSAYFEQDIGEAEQKGLSNQIADVKLLQGDLAEAWREGPVEYATVAMRYQLVDQTIDKRTGRVVEGGPTPQQVVELWTFRREPGNGMRWVLSAIQQGN